MIHQEPSPGLFASQKREAPYVIAALAVVLLAGAVGLYPAAKLGWAGVACFAFLLTAGGFLFVLAILMMRRHRFLQTSRFHALENDRLALQVEEAQVNYQSIFNNAAQGIFQSTPEGSFITANPALAKMFGMEDPEELINAMSGWPARHFLSDQVRWAEMVQYLLWQDSVAEFEAEAVRKDGRTLWISQNVHAVWDENDEMLYLEGTIFDVTERHWAECRRALQVSATRILDEAASVAEARPRILEAICELLDWEVGAVWEVAMTDNVLRCVEIWHRPGIDIAEFEDASLETGFTPGMRLAGKVWQTGEPAWVVNFSEQEFSANALVAARYGMNSAFGIPIKVGGEVLQVLEFFSPRATEPDPELLQMLGVVASQIGHLVERKLAEEALRDTVIRKEAILESALDAMVTFDHEGKIVEWNPAAERTFGHRKADVLGSRLVDLILPESARCALGGGLPIYNAGLSFGRRSEIVALRQDGQEFPAEIAIARAQLQGKPLYTAYVRDLTELRRAERCRHELAAVLEATHDAVFSATLDGVVLSWNAGAERLFGYAEREMIGRPASLLMPPERQEAFCRELGELRQGKIVRDLECDCLAKSGERIAVLLTEAPMHSGQGGLSGRGGATGMVGVVRRSIT